MTFALDLLRTYGFTEFTSFIATKPAEKSVGDPKMWDFAIASLKKAADSVGLKYQIDEGGGAFYGPKIDIRIKDAIGREWQCSTVQFDFNLPERFDLTYTGADNKPHRPYMVHRALYGSLERFFGVLIEHHEGRFPLWLAPTQVRLLPITDRAEVWAKTVREELLRADIRTEIAPKEPLKAMVADAEQQKIPYMLVMGDKDVDAGGVSPRQGHGGKQLPMMKPAEFVTLVKDEIAKQMSVSQQQPSS